MQAKRQRKTRFLALLVLASLIGGRSDAGGPAPEIPLLLPSPDKAQTTPDPTLPPSSTERPAWVSARAIRPEGGTLVNWNLLPPGSQKRYETAHRKRLDIIESARSAGDLAKAEALARCPETPTKFFRSNHSRRNYSLKDLTLYSEAIYRGTVRARDSGFMHGRTGSLLQLEIDRALKTPDSRPIPSELFFEYPFADFRIGDMLFCLRPDRTPAAPEVGDSVLVFVLFPPADRGLMIDSRSEEILFESSTGVLSLPAKLRSDPLAEDLKSLAGAEERILRMMASSADKSGGAR